MAQGDYIELHRKRHGRKLDHEERTRRPEAAALDALEALLARADLNRDGRLSYEEFRALAPVLGLRVTAPLAVFVAIKMLLAPVLAWNIVAQASKSERLLAFGESLTLPGVLDRIIGRGFASTLAAVVDPVHEKPPPGEAPRFATDIMDPVSDSPRCENIIM